MVLSRRFIPPQVEVVKEIRSGSSHMGPELIVVPYSRLSMRRTMKSRSIFSIITIGLAFLAPSVFSQGPPESDLKGRFLGEAPEAWAKFSTRSSRLQGTLIGKVFRLTPEKKLVSEGYYEIKQAPGCGIVLTQSRFPDRGAKSLQRHMLVENTQYRFLLSQKEKGSNWTLSGAVEKGALKEPRKFGDTTGCLYAKGLVNLPIGINFNVEDSWPNIIASPEFKVLSVSQIEMAGEVLVRVDYHLGWEPSPSNAIRLVGRGTVWLDPKHFWVMRKSEYKLKYGVKGVIRNETASYDYDFASDGFPIIKHAIAVDDSKNEEAAIEHSYSLQLTDVAEHEFTMTVFGLPEPVGVIWPQPVKWWIWLSLAALGALVLAALGAILRKRILSRELNNKPKLKDGEPCDPSTGVALP
jgi:hypothetical protein